MDISGDGHTIKNMEIFTQDNAPGASGCLILHDTKHLIQGNDIHTCGTGNPGTGLPPGHAIYLAASDTIIERNTLHDVQGYGMHGWKNTGNLTGNTVRNNTIYNVGGISGFGIVFGAQSGSATGNIANNNIIYNSSGGMMAYTSASSNNFFNNTVYNTSLCMRASSAGVNTWRNNLCFGTDGSISLRDSPAQTAGNNLFGTKSDATNWLKDPAKKDFRTKDASAK